jgi:hypothetical protein
MTQKMKENMSNVDYYIHTAACVLSLYEDF